VQSPRRLSLNQIQIIAWGASALCALVVCVGVVFGISFAQYSSKSQNEFQQFLDKSSTAFRRIEAELAVNNNQAVPALTNMFEKELGISSIELSETWPPLCPNNISCNIKNSEGAIAAVKIETRYGNYILVSKQKLSTFWENFSVGSLWWMVLALGALSFLGVLIQRVITRKYIANPISHLVNKALSKEEVPPYYPAEIAQLAKDLSDSINARDQVIFGQLASGVIHDLRTQIQSMISATSLIGEVSEDGVKRKTRLEILYQAADRNLPKMLSVIESTLDGSREISISPTQTDLQKTISACVDECSTLAQARNVRVELSTEDLPKIAHDGPQVERVFSNLLKNAIEAFDEDLDSTSIRTVRLSARGLKNSIEIDVEDSGPGIAIPQRDLFKLSRTTKPNGYGLGLMVSRRIVEAHRGKIESGRSLSLNGAKFTVKLPLGGVQ